MDDIELPEDLECVTLISDAIPILIKSILGEFWKKEGGYGTIKFSIADGEIHVSWEHAAYVVDEDWSASEGSFKLPQDATIAKAEKEFIRHYNTKPHPEEPIPD